MRAQHSVILILLVTLLLAACAPASGSRPDSQSGGASPIPPTATAPATATPELTATVAPEATPTVFSGVKAVAKRDTKTFSGPDSVVYSEAGALPKGRDVVVVGKYTNRAGELWYQLAEGEWVWSILLTADDNDAIPEVASSEIEVVPTESSDGVITSEVIYVARVRKGPSPNSPVLDTFYVGQKMEVLGEYHTWYKVRTTTKEGENVVGWVRVVELKSFHQPVPEITPGPQEVIKVTPTPEATPTLEQAIVTAKKNSNLRKGPGTIYDRAGVLEKNAEAIAVGKHKAPDGHTWLKLKDGSWIRDDLVSTNMAKSQLPDVAASQIPATPTPRPATPTPEAPPAPVNPANLAEFASPFAELYHVGQLVDMKYREGNRGYYMKMGAVRVVRVDEHKILNNGLEVVGLIVSNGSQTFRIAVIIKNPAHIGTPAYNAMKFDENVNDMFLESDVPLSASIFQPGTEWLMGDVNYFITYDGNPVEFYWQDPNNSGIAALTVNLMLPLVTP